MSAFQKRVRGGATVLTDHICKEMNELNLERCACIPKNVPGADWRVLLEIVAADPSRETYKARRRPIPFIHSRDFVCQLAGQVCRLNERLLCWSQEGCQMHLQIQ